MSSATAAKTKGQMDVEYGEWRDRQVIRTFCVVEDCDWEVTGPAGESRDAAAEHRAKAHPTLRPRSRDQLRAAKKTAEKADQVRAREERTLARGNAVSAAPTKEPKKGARWTLERAIAGVQAKAAELGRAPSVEEARADKRIPSPPTAKKLCGGWGELVELAGFPRPTRATRYADTNGKADVAPAEAAAAPPTPPRGSREPKYAPLADAGAITETVLAAVRAEHERQIANLTLVLRRFAAGILELVESLDPKED